MISRNTVGKLNCAGIISTCPVCLSGTNPQCDEQCVFINGNWFHGSCSRFANFVCAEENCPVCDTNTCVQDGDIDSGRWWMACATCRLPVARWHNFPGKPERILAIKESIWNSASTCLLNERNQ